MDPKLLAPILLAGVVVWGIVRRLRRTFGRQRVEPGRIWLRIGALTLAGGLIAAASVTRGAEMLEGLIAGLACGAGLGYLGLRHTRFEVTPEGRFYTPHTYIGLAVTVLLLGRLVYRFLYLSTFANGMSGPDPNAAVAYQRSPLTVGIFAVLVGYYVLFYAGVLLKSRVSDLPPANPVSPE